MDSSIPFEDSVLDSDNLRALIGQEAVNVLKCSICFEFYTEPVILACGHTFCFRCLLEMAKHAKNNNSKVGLPIHTVYIGCPNCRRPIYISAILSRRLTQNYPMASFIESLRQKKVVKKVTRGTNTDGAEDTKPRKKIVEKEGKRKRHIDEKYDILTENLDAVLRTLSANGTVLGDLSCAADIQQIVQEHQENIQNFEDFVGPGNDMYTSFETDCRPSECINNYDETPRDSLNLQPNPINTSPSHVQGPVGSTFEDPAILSYSIDPEPLPPFGLFAVPGGLWRI